MNVTTKTITISYEFLEDMLVPYLISLGALTDTEAENTVLMDFPVALNDRGSIDIDFEILNEG